MNIERSNKEEFFLLLKLQNPAFGEYAVVNCSRKIETHHPASNIDVQCSLWNQHVTRNVFAPVIGLKRKPL